ncbi:MAG: hypothetical protein ACI3XZ_03565 [Butyricicoccus sp.]
MWLKLNLDGIKLYFNIKGYRKSSNSNWDDEWCGVELNVLSENWLNYSQSGELLLACEVEEILLLFEDLVEDRILEPREIEFIEPDFKFALHPQKNLMQDSSYIYVRPGHEIVDIDAEFKVFFWDGCLTANYLSLCMDREDILDFITYLKVITNQISETDEHVQVLLKKETLLKY